MFDSDTKAPSDRGSPPSKPEGSSTSNKAAASVPDSSSKFGTAKSAAAEIAVPQDASKLDPLGDAIKRCKAHAKGESVFKASVAHIFEGLTEAYPTYLLIKDNKDDHQRVIDELMAKGNRERTPSLNKAAYNATELACHPDDPEGYSNCSDWANVVTLASFEEVPVENFRSWVQDKKIGETKRKVRAAKQANKPLKTPFAEGDFPVLAELFKRCADPGMRQLMKDELTFFEAQLKDKPAPSNLV